MNPLRSPVARRALYVREWLNSQAAAGYVLYHAASATYELTPEQAMVLANEDSPVFLPPAWAVPVSMWMDEDKALKAFRTSEASVGTSTTSGYSRIGRFLSERLPNPSGIRMASGPSTAGLTCQIRNLRKMPRR